MYRDPNGNSMSPQRSLAADARPVTTVQLGPGIIYRGEVRDGRLQGKGRMETPSGVYEGFFVDNKKHGWGRFQSSYDPHSGVPPVTALLEYEGEWVNDQPNGKCLAAVFYVPPAAEGSGPQREYYGGLCIHGRPHGRGRYTHADGRVYEGDFEDGKRNGFGKLVMPNGDVMEGQFRGGKIHGEGRAVTHGGTREYTGTFQKGLMKEGRMHFRDQGEKAYKGEWEQERPHGKGIMTQENGDVYAGEFANGQYEGRGLFQYRSNGMTYEGGFSGGVPDGSGEVTLVNGAKIAVAFTHGTLTPESSAKFGDAVRDHINSRRRQTIMGMRPEPSPTPHWSEHDVAAEKEAAFRAALQAKAEEEANQQRRALEEKERQRAWEQQKLRDTEEAQAQVEKRKEDARRAAMEAAAQAKAAEDAARRDAEQKAAALKAAEDARAKREAEQEAARRRAAEDAKRAAEEKTKIQMAAEAAKRQEMLAAAKDESQRKKAALLEAEKAKKAAVAEDEARQKAAEQERRNAAAEAADLARGAAAAQREADEDAKRRAATEKAAELIKRRQSTGSAGITIGLGKDDGVSFPDVSSKDPRFPTPPKLMASAFPRTDFATVVSVPPAPTFTPRNPASYLPSATQAAINERVVNDIDQRLRSASNRFEAEWAMGEETWATAQDAEDDPGKAPKPKANLLEPGFYRNFKFPGGSVYTGDIGPNEHRQGPAKYSCASYRYEGEYRGDKRHGYGVMVANPSVPQQITKYEGGWVADVKEGPCSRAEVKGGSEVYIGGFRNNVFHGAGRYEFADGRVYEGEFVSGVRQGTGRMQWPNGDMYEGAFVEGKLQGFGRLINQNGAREFVGTFSDGKKVKGMVLFRDQGGKRYDGEWRAEKPHGQGMMVLASGDLYRGTLVDGRLHGEGVLYYLADRKSFVGNFDADKIHGAGCMRYHDEPEKSVAGQWNAGKRVTS